VAGATSASGRARQVWSELDALDRAAHRAIADTPSPTIDASLRRLSDAANESKLWLVAGAALFAVGGARGRRAALQGVASIGCTSVVTNLVVKPLLRRGRPERPLDRSPRHTKMPKSPSFPSGHAASAFAFANGAAATMPLLGLPLRALAGAVAYSRVHAGVHYPGDVVVGALLGAAVGDVVVAALAGMENAIRSPRR
jgi:undecaprenyl-diphosphatase